MAFSVWQKTHPHVYSCGFLAEPKGIGVSRRNETELHARTICSRGTLIAFGFN